MCWELSASLLYAYCEIDLVLRSASFIKKPLSFSSCPIFAPTTFSWFTESTVLCMKKQQNNSVLEEVVRILQVGSQVKEILCA